MLYLNINLKQISIKQKYEIYELGNGIAGLFCGFYTSQIRWDIWCGYSGGRSEMFLYS
jgi:hypothetical protein